MQCVWRRRLCDQRAMEQIPPSALIMRSGGKWVSVGFLIRNVKKHYNILRVWSTIYLSSPGSHIHRALNTHEAQCPQTILRKIRSRTGEVGQTQNAKNDEYTKGICSSHCGQWKVFSDRFPESASGPHQPSPHQFCCPKLRVILFHQVAGMISHMLWSFITEINLYIVWMGLNDQRQNVLTMQLFKIY